MGGGVMNNTNKKVLTFVQPGKKICFAVEESGTTMGNVNLLGKKRSINSIGEKVELPNIKSLPELRNLISNLEKKSSKSIKLILANLENIVYEVDI